MSSPADCRFRRHIRFEDGQETATCERLASVFGSRDERLVRVHRDACEACCSVLESEGRFNRVLASLIYRRAHQRRTEQPLGPDAGLLSRLEEEARFRLQYTTNQISQEPGALGMLGKGDRRLPFNLRPAQALSWSVAVLTAPREQQTLANTLRCLERSGFERMHLFAEPGATIPTAHAALPCVRHCQRQGPLRNFSHAAQALLDARPNMDAYAFFEDDIEVAEGLRSWCDHEFWPGGHDIVSLYTSRVFCDDRPGWQTLNLGRYRTFGALALVFRGPALREFLADAEVRKHIQDGKPGTDAVVGEWALKRGIGIAYHSPSLVQHVGYTTSLAGHSVGRVGQALAVKRTEAIASWRPPEARRGRIGLVGWNTRTGLGYQNRDIAVHLCVARWLAPQHPTFASLSPPRMAGEYRAARSGRLAAQELRAWLSGLEWLLFVEQPYLPGLVQHARELGISVACIPNWEWLTHGLDWLPYVDLMICPTLATYRMLLQWRRDLGFTWDVVHVPWPVDPQRFDYRRRERCRKFVFANGTGGGRGRRTDGSRTPYRRKGFELLAATARLLRTVPFLCYSQQVDLPSLPDNVELRRGPSDNRELYVEGDVCVQPSHWEGLGLQLLECQAAGLPLVTTDAPPMNEHRPFRTVPVSETELVFVYGDQPVEAQLVRPETLAEVLQEIHGTDIGEASQQARRFIEQHRSWAHLRETLAAWLTA